jgi:glycerophosphoryl diester phosphodiesterase
MSTVPIAIAHRGDPIAERENTLPAFEAAVLAGADMVELDLRRTADGEIVVLHDATLSRLWGVDAAVEDLELAALERIGHRGVRIPTLGQVLDAVEVPLMVDFTSRKVVPGAVAAVRDRGAMGRALFVTGNVDALRELRDLAPEARIGLTWVDSGAPSPSLLEALGAEYWNPTAGLVTPEHVGAVHALGLKVSTWTVDQAAEMARVTQAGVDAIVSNRIGALRRFLRNPRY